MYHVVARANRKEFILNSDEMKTLFLQVVDTARKKYSFQITNFCIMGNHFHLMITPSKGENLSKIMQWILSVFAIRYNRIFGYTGHVWYDRFKSKIIDGLQQFLHAFFYILENPVRAGLVKKPWDYKFNGVTFLRNRDYRIIEKPDAVLSLVADSYISPFLLT